MKRTFWIFLSLGALTLQGQDARLAQFWANGMRMNPGMITNGLDKGQSRISSGYRNQWSSLQAPFNSMSMAYEQPLKGENSSFGLLINRDIAGSGKYQNLSINGVYGYGIQLQGETKAQFGLQLGYQHSSLDRTDMRFLDGIDPIMGYLGTQEMIPFVQKGYINTAVGAVLEGGTGVIGLSIHNINQPKYSFYSNSDNLIPRRYTAHGYFKIGANTNHQLRPTVVAMKQGEFSDLSAGLSYMMGSASMHGYYRRSFLNQGNADALSFAIGINAAQVYLGYSYDMTLSNLKTNMPNSHELSIRWLLGEASSVSAINKPTLEMFDSDMVVEIKSLSDIKRLTSDHQPDKILIPSLEGQTADKGFYISVGLATSEEEADQSIKTLLTEEIRAYKMQDPASGNYYLFIEYFKNENEAREALLDLEQTMSRVWIREVR